MQAGNNEFHPLERSNREPANKLQPWQQKRNVSSRVESRRRGYRRIKLVDSWLAKKGNKKPSSINNTMIDDHQSVKQLWDNSGSTVWCPLI